MDATSQISLYTTLFYVSLGITVLGLALAVFFFFYFDIPAVFAMMTGKARKETIRRMEEQNAKTGNLRFEYPSGNSGKTGRTGGKTGRFGKTGETAAAGKSGRTGAPPAGSVPPRENRAVTQVPIQPERAETSVLQQHTTETTVLREDAGQTTLLGAVGQPQSEQPQPKPPKQPVISFRMTENTVVIHTDEMI